jgi:uncharacterized protein (TIGR02145 family)
MKKLALILMVSCLSIVVTRCTKSDSTDPTPAAIDPYAMFQYSIKANGIVTFTNQSTNATSCLWDFGDGTTSTTSTVTFDHQYSHNGTFHATLTAYGNGKSAGAYANLSITSFVNETISDLDGNVYHTVTIGTQVWMVENLKTTKFNDGTTIPLVTDNTEWGALITPGYCWYNNDEATYKNPYGAMYNWYAVNSGKLAPAGWHVPTNADFSVLTTFLGGVSSASGKLKEAGTTHWQSPNEGATNESGFTALPGGERFSNGGFYYNTERGYWWCSTEEEASEAWGRTMSSFYSDVNPTFFIKELGLSVRCVKN